eukprot:scaffold13572_cov96-Isochrysis_galbana.AAC.1
MSEASSRSGWRSTSSAPASASRCSRKSVLAVVTGRAPHDCTRFTSAAASGAHEPGSPAQRAMAATCFSLASNRSSVVAFHTAVVTSSIPTVCRLRSPACAFLASMGSPSVGIGHRNRRRPPRRAPLRYLPVRRPSPQDQRACRRAGPPRGRACGGRT